MRTIFTYFTTFALTLLMLGCEKDITLYLPANPPLLVVEGRMELGEPPLVILTKSQGYFAPTDLRTFEKSIVTDAEVEVSDGVKTQKLSVICSSDPQLQPFLAQISTATGIPLEQLTQINYCIYTGITGTLLGEAGKTYTLTIKHENKTYTAQSTLPVPIPLDTIYWKENKNKTNLNDPIPYLGFLHCRLTDPPGLGNCYRFFARRITKDRRFLTLNRSVFEDKFFDGKTFDFDVFRAQEPNSTKPDDTGRQRFNYLPTDTVIVKYCTIDRDVFEFYRSFGVEVGNNGNPFSTPAVIKTNIKGGALGVWATYGTSLDTVYLSR